MSFWSRIKARWSREPAPARESAPAREPEPSVAPEKQPATNAALEPLKRLAQSDAPDEASVLSALASARGTSNERAALDAVMRAHLGGSVVESIRTRAAEIFLQRGEREQALELLSAVSGIPGLLLAADVFAERGEIARALTLVERVLARDIDAPGARERHERWRIALGVVSPNPPAVNAEPTLLRAETPDISLRIVGEAGRGGAGTVYEAIDDALGRRVALKIYHRPEEDRDKLECEAKTAVELAGRGIVRVFDADVARGSIVMEWLPGGALKHWILREPARLLPLERWLVPLLEALARVHAAGVVHGDLKPANVMLRALDEPVLGDFGLARRAGEPLAGGSLGFMSPERFDGASAAFDEDVYAFGRVLEDALEALNRTLPEWAAAERPHWRTVVDRLLAPSGTRPLDATGALDLCLRRS